MVRHVHCNVPTWNMKPISMFSRCLTNRLNPSSMEFNTSVFVQLFLSLTRKSFRALTRNVCSGKLCVKQREGSWVLFMTRRLRDEGKARVMKLAGRKWLRCWPSFRFYNNHTSSIYEFTHSLSLSYLHSHIVTPTQRDKQGNTCMYISYRDVKTHRQSKKKQINRYVVMAT